VVCSACGSTRLKVLRAGVSRVREELEALAGIPVYEVWGDNDTRPAAGWSLLVGTEAVLHRVVAVDVVVFLDFDAELLAPRFRAGEEALALIARAAQVVAVGEKPPRGREVDVHSGVRAERAGGLVVLQTRMPHHDVVLSAVGADPGLMVPGEREIRRQLGLPPYGALAKVSGASGEELISLLQAAPPSGVEISQEGSSWLLSAETHEVLCDALDAVGRPAGRLRIEVDPLRI
jgi:primosomal protein N' (replication factor Y)